MARLNDLPPSTESLDALKRRFTRQNRDLARTNSAQSQRIRNLETEISRLLAENISLREAAIAAQKERDEYNSNPLEGEADIWRNEVAVLKEKLEMQVRGLFAVVGEMGGVEGIVDEKSREKREKQKQRRKSSHGILGMGDVRSPDQRDWRNRQTLAGVLNAEQEGRLPVIVEDKLYPRRTLEPLEIKNRLDADLDAAKDSESPDLGPPPVAHFDVDNPVNYEVGGGEGEEVVQLSSNLETRRKRRTSSFLKDMTSDEEQPEKKSLFKLGAKRKLEASELEDVVPSGSENEEFVFSRRPALKAANSSNRKTSRFSRPTQQGEIVVPVGAGSPKKGDGERKMLGEKSTNSPSKRQTDGKSEANKIPPRRRDTAKSDRTDNTRPQSKEARSTSTRTTTTTADLPPAPDVVSDSQDHPPKTPFLSDILSPPSSQPSAPSNQAPEAAILNSLEDVLNGSIGRASRRAKAAVSYAEPNLRDKMRRPGGRVGAIEGMDGTVKKERGRESFSRGVSEEVEGKRESISVDAEDGAWVLREREREARTKAKQEPGSSTPLNEKPSFARDAHVQGNDGERERERERDRAGAIKRHAQARREQKMLQDLSGNGPMTGNDNDYELSAAAPEITLKDAVNRLSIFDGPSSSPSASAETGNAPVLQPAVTKDKHAPTSSSASSGAVVRRKMSITANTNHNGSSTTSNNTAVIGREAGRRHSMAPSTATNTGLIASRSVPAPPRPSSATSHRGQREGERERLGSATGHRSEREVGAGSAGAGGLKRSASITHISRRREAGVVEGVGMSVEDESQSQDGAGERVGMRRRSMMV